MDYNLAKKLKDAGFPDSQYMDLEDILDRPTLSELIEACGDKFGQLDHYQNDEKWKAEAKEMYMATGKTAEEAVANLWLVLNKK